MYRDVEAIIHERQHYMLSHQAACCRCCRDIAGMLRRLNAPSNYVRPVIDALAIAGRHAIINRLAAASCDSGNTPTSAFRQARRPARHEHRWVL